MFEIRAIGKLDNKEYVLRRLEDQDKAIAHVLKANMEHWDDIYIVEVAEKTSREILAAPKFPWIVEWTRGFAYVLDADGNKIAVLLGPQKQREFVAEILCNLQ